MAVLSQLDGRNKVVVCCFACLRVMDWGNLRLMKLLKTILGGILALAFVGAAAAEPTMRPYSRNDAAVARVAAKDLNLAVFRVKARPSYMIRYPVVLETRTPTVRPVARTRFIPRTRWDANGGSKMWTRTAMAAVGEDGAQLDSVVPRDIERWCPAYEQNSATMRSAFWVGMMSALSKHESTYNPRAVGGGGLWYGLLQIYPDTARRYGCRATTGERLKNPMENLACAARIMAVTVKRDQAVAIRDSRWRGVAADWGPMTKPSKIAEMSAWTSRQSYCQPVENTRPNARPMTDAWTASISTKG